MDIIKEPKWYYWSLRDYRIKPKFRPFKNAEEFLEAQRRHGVEMSSGEFLFINSNDIVCVHKPGCLEIEKCSFEYLFKNFKFEDGTPCGKEVQL